MIKAFRNFVVFKTDTLHNTGTVFKGIGGKNLVLGDPNFDPAKHVRIYGEVLSLPIELTDIPITQEYKGLPSYSTQSPYRYKFLSDISQEIKVGDRIYYHFNTIKPHNMINVEGVHPNRTWYIKVRYDQIICAVRDGNIIPIGGYMLVDPDFESWEDIMVPTYSNIQDNDGKPILKPKSQWLVRKSAPGYKYLLGFVRHVGTPLRGDKVEVKVGQKIVYTRNADWLVNIEGKDYFVIKQRHVLGRWEEE